MFDQITNGSDLVNSTLTGLDPKNEPNSDKNLIR